MGYARDDDGALLAESHRVFWKVVDFVPSYISGRYSSSRTFRRTP